MLAAVVFWSLSLLVGGVAHADAPIPPPPQYYVLDQPKVLSPGAKRAIETLLIEHDRTTHQQILVAIFSGLNGEELNDRTERVFTKWGIGQRGQDEGALLAVYWNDHKARIEVGYGLESALTDARTKRILEDALIPGLRAKDTDYAFEIATYQILAAVDSPLISSGRVEQVLRGKGGAKNRPLDRSYPTPMRAGWIVWLFLGGILFIIAMNLLTSADAHFTGAGWYRPRPWKRGGWRVGGSSPFFGGGFPWGGGGGRGDFPTGGGGRDRGSDGGGFVGGGGMSGGGGSSASW